MTVEIAAGQTDAGYLLIPPGPGPFPAVLVPYYEPETSTGQSKQRLRDFAYQLTNRGFVTLSIGSPGGDARKPELGGIKLQPLSLPLVTWRRIVATLGITPRSGCEANRSSGAFVWGKMGDVRQVVSAHNSPPPCGRTRGSSGMTKSGRASIIGSRGILGLDPAVMHRPGLITADNPRTGAYTKRCSNQATPSRAPSPHGPAPVSRFRRNRRHGRTDGSSGIIAIAVNKLLGYEDRVGMTNRATHEPTVESNEVIYQFFEHFLKPR